MSTDESALPPAHLLPIKYSVFVPNPQTPFLQNSVYTATLSSSPQALHVSGCDLCTSVDLTLNRQTE